jgi:cation diffusion facilitator CzcD-associated flavoprotein CzcO
VLKSPVTNGSSVTAVELAGEFLAVSVEEAGRVRTCYVCHVVFATGRGCTGGLHVPEMVDPALFPDLAAHSAEHIDFPALRGKAVAVMGGGASAWEQCRLGTRIRRAQVDMYVRRKVLPQVNKTRGTSDPGFLLGWEALDDAQRSALTVYIEDLQAPPPH